MRPESDKPTIGIEPATLIESHISRNETAQRTAHLTFERRRNRINSGVRIQGGLQDEAVNFRFSDLGCLVGIMARKITVAVVVGVAVDDDVLEVGMSLQDD